jgi:hypothetical protein
MAEAVALLAKRFADSAGTPVTYTRGTASKDMTATIGRTPYEVTDGNGVTISAESTVFFLQAAHLVLDGCLLLPARGDRITKRSTGEVYEVSIPSPLNLYERRGPNGEVLKVYTKGPL